MAQQLFSVPIEAVGAHPGGAIVGTSPQPKVYALTWTSPPDNRITVPFCKALLSALDIIEFGDYEPGVVITTSGIPKFYSNGLDLELAIQTPGFWALFYSVWARFLSFPMPTIALLNGHTYAGGLMLSMAHDYRLAPSPRGFLCLNEVLFGAPLKPPMAAIFRHKLSPPVCRSLALEAKRMTGADAVAMGVADGLCPNGLDDALALIEERSLLEKAKAGVYGVIKAELYNKLIKELQGAGLEEQDARFEATQERDAERQEFGKVWYDQWKKGAKL